MVTAVLIESFSGLYPQTGALTLHRKEGTATGDGYNATTVTQTRCRKQDVSLERVVSIAGTVQGIWTMFEIWNDGQTMPRMEDKLVDGAGGSWHVRTNGERLMGELYSYICEKMKS